MAQYSRLAAVVGTLAISLGIIAAAQRPEQLPDIDVLYIERTPRYPGYALDYGRKGSEGVPVLIDNKARQPLSGAQALGVKRWPTPNEPVTFIAHVQNRGNAPAPAWEFVWYIDDLELARGQIASAQAVGQEAVISQTWPWRPGRHTVRFVADPLFKVRDLSLHNNQRTDATDAWSLIWGVDRQTYESFNRNRNFLGTKSFEDWAQWHIDRMNQLFDESPGVQALRRSGVHASTTQRPSTSTSTSTTDATTQRPNDPTTQRPSPRIRCDKVVVVDDTEKLWDSVLGKEVAPLDAGYDGAWGFGRRDEPGCIEWAANADWGLIHEWGHQLGLTDEYALDRPGFQNMTPDEGGDPLLIGHRSMLQGYMMHGHGPTAFSPLCMAALRSQIGRRRGYYGDYYYNVPKVNVLQVLDNRGKPVEGAKVSFWQDRENEYGGTPVFSGVTDRYGAFTMPNRPAPHITTDHGFTQHDNPFGQINVVGPGDVFFIRIQARGHTEYTWMEIAEFNLAYWSRETDRAVFTRKTRIPPANAPKAPVSLAATVNRELVKLNWTPVSGAVGYRVYHGSPEEYRFQQAGDLRPRSRLSPIVTTPFFEDRLGSGALHRYAVTAIRKDGTESGFSNVVGVMHFARPWGIAVTKDGKRLIRDAQYENTVLQKPNGSTVGLVGSVHYHFEGSYDLAIDPAGRVLTAKWPDGYNPKTGFKVQSADMKLVFEHLESAGNAPGQVRGPMGIASDSKGNIFIADTGNDRIQQFAPDGRFLRIIGVDEVRVPMKVAFDKQDHMYVADSGHNRIAIFEPQPDGGYKLSKSITGIKEPCYVTVDSRGRVFASANREAGVFMWDSAGNRVWKYDGEKDAALSGPRGLAVDPAGNLLIVDEASLRVISVKPPD